MESAKTTNVLLIVLLGIVVIGLFAVPMVTTTKVVPTGDDGTAELTKSFTGFKSKKRK